MQAQLGVVLGFSDMGAKRPDSRPATLSPDICNGLPKGFQTQNIRRAKLAEKNWGHSEKDFILLFSLRKVHGKV